MLSESLACPSKEGAGGPMFRRRCRRSPPVLENVGGRSGRDSGAGHARPFPQGGCRPQQGHPVQARPRPCQPPLAKSELVCYNTLMKSATGPLLFLGACRIHEHWGLTMESPPVAGALREQPEGQDPPRKGWGRSQCRCMAQAPWSRPRSVAERDGSVTVGHGSGTAVTRLCHGLSTPRHAFVTPPRLKTPKFG